MNRFVVLTVALKGFTVDGPPGDPLNSNGRPYYVKMLAKAGTWRHCRITQLVTDVEPNPTPPDPTSVIVATMDHKTATFPESGRIRQGFTSCFASTNSDGKPVDLWVAGSSAGTAVIQVEFFDSLPCSKKWNANLNAWE